VLFFILTTNRKEEKITIEKKVEKCKTDAIKILV